MEGSQQKYRYYLRSRTNATDGGKTFKQKLRQSTTSTIKNNIKAVLNEQFQCKLQVKPVVPLDSHLNFNCQVQLEDINIDIHRNERTNERPILVERSQSDHLQGVTGFERETKDIDALNNLCGDGSLSAFSKCNEKKCDPCSFLKPTDYFASTVTHRLYKCINREWPMTVNCTTSNIIYLITCNCCGFQYVGETSQTVRNRIKQHKSDIKCGKKNTYFVQHFNNGRCKGATFTFQVIENLAGTGRTDDNRTDPLSTPARRSRETQWMLALRTVYPYGLNEKIGESGDLNRLRLEDDGIIGKKFPKLPRTTTRVAPVQGNSNADYSSFNHRQFLESLIQKLQQDIRNAPNFIRVALYSMHKKPLKELANNFREVLENQGDDYMCIQWCLMAIDIINTRLFKPQPVKPKRNPPKHRIRLQFTSKAMDFISLPRILRSDVLKESRPAVMTDDDIPMVVYKLTPPIRSAILNYSKFVSSFDLNAFHLDNNTIPCHCHEFDNKYIDNHHNHILTGDLSIIQNNKLSKLISKGPKYREPTKIDFVLARSLIQSGVEDFLEVLATKHKVDVSTFDGWKAELMRCVDSKIERVMQSFVKREVYPVLEDKEVRNFLKGLHDKFVFVPIDKASNNIAIVCKRLYASVIYNELDYANILSSNFCGTYQFIPHKIPSSIISEHIDYQKVRNFEVEEDMEKLPTMYWSPKIHKTPTGARFIIASKLSSLKPLAIDITAIFKCIFSHLRRYYGMAEFYSGIKHFWVVDNNSDVVASLDKISAKGKARSVSTFDFSTLYTKIPHDKLINVLNELVDFVFNSSDRVYLSVTDSGARWVKEKGRCRRVYDKKKVKDVVKYLIENCFFTIGNLLFRQSIGMPMGSDPAPFFANLFLFFYEVRWIKSTKKLDYARARRFLNTFRFIDDLIAANDYGEFERSFKEIYPPELTLKKENTIDTKGTFYDLDIAVKEGKFDHKLYDKRDSFNFSIVRFPYKDSNIPSKMFHSTIGAEVLRICRATSTYNSFLMCCEPFIFRMSNQGANKRSIHNVISKFINRHQEAFLKFKLPLQQIALDITSQS